MTITNPDRKKISLSLAILSSVLLLYSGTTGVVSWLRTKTFILDYMNLQILELPLLILTAIASFGGLSVLVGGILIYREKFFWGRLLIALGSGAGIISISLNIITIISTGANVNFFESFLSFSSLGFIFALASQIISLKIDKNDKQISPQQNDASLI